VSAVQKRGYGCGEWRRRPVSVMDGEGGITAWPHAQLIEFAPPARGSQRSKSHPTSLAVVQCVVVPP
jgi:hypothetical protein